MSWIRIILLALLLAPIAGCTALGIAPHSDAAAVRRESLLKMDPASIQVDTMGFADRFVTTMTGIYDEIERGTSDVATKDAAHGLKTDLALGAISAAVNPRPIAGMIDMVVLVTLLRQIAEDPWTVQTFGADAARVVQALRLQEADIRKMARRYLTDSQLAELGQLSENWHRMHPDERRVSHVHLADLPEANQAPEESAKLPNSIFALLFFDPTANLDPAIREIELSRAATERMFFYIQRLPLLLQLQAESSYRQVLDAPQLKQALDNVSAATQTAARFTEVSDRFTDVAAHLPKQLAAEREQAINDIASELTRQRDMTINRLAEAVTAERNAAITQATTQFASQRDQAVEQMAGAIRQEQDRFVSNLEAATDRAINRLLQGIGLLGVIGLIAITATAAVYHAFTRQKNRGRG